MKAGDYPIRSISETPVMTMKEPCYAESWWFDHDGTRYRVIAVNAGDSTLVCAGHGEPKGTWVVLDHAMGSGDELAMTYLAEKLALRPGDYEGWAMLISAACGWRVFWTEQVDADHWRQAEAVAGVKR